MAKVVPERLRNESALLIGVKTEEHAAHDSLVQRGALVVLEVSLCMLRELRPRAEIASPTMAVDQGDQPRGDVRVYGVVHRDHLEHLLRRERGEANMRVQPRLKHRLATQHLVAAGATNKGQRERGGRVVVQVPEVE